MYPEELRYTKDHEWIRKEGDVYVVGITAHAAEQLGDITYVELPEVGAEVDEGDAAGAVESVKAASDIYAPVGGHIVALNEALEAQPELVNESPYEEGWFFKLESVDTAEVETLMDNAAYEAYLGELAE